MYDSQCIVCYSDLLPNGECPVCSARTNQSKRGRAYKRHHRRRIIEKRKNIYFHIWNNDEWYLNASLKFGGEYVQSHYAEHPGRLAKHNLSCNCGMCKGEKHWDVPTVKDLIAKEKYKIEVEDLE